VKILVIGSGAREHAIVRALAHVQPNDEDLAGLVEPPPADAVRPSQPVAHTLFAAPGNPGIGQLAELHHVDVLDPAAIAALAEELAADLVVIGPEGPLVAGAVDAVQARGIACFGPSAQAARLEGSKSFAKEVMAAAGVPTAQAVQVHSTEEVAAALDAFGPPYVVKDDGLAAGKGVVVTEDRAVAAAHAERICSAGGSVVVEEYLNGPEVSLFCLTDGKTVVPLEPAHDFKRLKDGDAGPNTGGMGAYSPLPWAPPELVEEVVEKIAKPTIAEMARRGTPFSGVLYCGLALTAQGIRVVEFNVRFGDPETQVVLARLATPLAEVLDAAARGRLDQIGPLAWRQGAAVTVVIAAPNYPERPITGKAIHGIDTADATPCVYVLQAGTERDASGRLVSAGGRVLSVVGVGDSLLHAQTNAYLGVTRIRLDGSHHRTDIALRAARELRRGRRG